MVDVIVEYRHHEAYKAEVSHTLILQEYVPPANTSYNYQELNWNQYKIMIYQKSIEDSKNPQGWKDFKWKAILLKTTMMGVIVRDELPDLYEHLEDAVVEAVFVFSDKYIFPYTKYSRNVRV